MIRPLFRLAVRVAKLPLRLLRQGFSGKPASPPAPSAPRQTPTTRPPPAKGPSPFDVQIDPAKVLERQRGGEALLFVDVRERGELMASGKIEGALHIPLRDVPTRHGEIGRDRDIVVYCAAGMRSLDAAMFLRDQGFEKVSSLSGGIGGWQQAGGTLVAHG